MEQTKALNALEVCISRITQWKQSNNYNSHSSLSQNQLHLLVQLPISSPELHQHQTHFYSAISSKHPPSKTSPTQSSLRISNFSRSSPMEHTLHTKRQKAYQRLPKYRQPSYGSYRFYHWSEIDRTSPMLRYRKPWIYLEHARSRHW
jgi:hypothetical protein